LLNIVDISKAIGPDGISPSILKERASILRYHLCKIFNISQRSGVFPFDWKKANVCPVFKKDSPALLQNYRPISLISIVGNEAMRIISGGTKLTSLRELYKENGLIKLKDRRENHGLI
jgi:hypothetical protein